MNEDLTNEQYDEEEVTMKYFKVEMGIKMIGTAIVLVEAADEEEATQKADDGDILEWIEEDFDDGDNCSESAVEITAQEADAIRQAKRDA